MPEIARRTVLSMAAAAGAAAPLLLAGPSAAAPVRSQAPEVVPVGAGAAADTAIAEVPIDGGARVLTDIADAGAAGAVYEVSRQEPFSMVAVVWDGAGAVTPRVRAQLADGQWDEWIELDVAHRPAGTQGRNGTEIVFVGTTTAVQIAMGGAVADVAKVSAVLVRPSDAPVLDPGPEAGAELEPADIAGRVPPRPAVVSRWRWGANEAIRCSRPYYDHSLGGVVVHHTAGSNNYTAAQAPGIVRGIYAYHAQTLGWCDIGYHALIDKYGTIYEGRFGGLDRPVQGVHTGGFNENTAGFSMIGNYSQVAPSAAQLNSLGKLVGWRLAVANNANPKGSQPTLTAFGKTVMYSEGTPYTWVPAGQAVTVPMVLAHRDVGYTECPGNTGYKFMNQIRQTAATYMNVRR